MKATPLCSFELLLIEIAGVTGARVRPLLRSIIGAGAVYGVCIGSFRGACWEGFKMMLYAALKVPLLLLGTAIICLPGFAVVTAVLGQSSTLKRILQAILVGQAAVALALCSLGPLVLFCYASGVEHRVALLVNAGAFACAASIGQAVTRRRCAALIDEEPRHRLLLTAWYALYVFVGIQMGWLLRPFVGDPDLSTTFFRAQPFSNAYVVVVGLIFGT